MAFVGWLERANVLRRLKAGGCLLIGRTGWLTDSLNNWLNASSSVALFARHNNIELDDSQKKLLDKYQLYLLLDKGGI